MDTILIIAQLVIALGILNVWILRPGRPTSWRGKDARSLRDEFRAYGLPGWMLFVVGASKITFAVMLVLGIWYPALTTPAAIGMVFLMLGAVAMHVKVGDSPRKSLPALTLLILGLMVAAG